jgi:hypothetical protein
MQRYILPLQKTTGSKLAPADEDWIRDLPLRMRTGPPGLPLQMRTGAAVFSFVLNPYRGPGAAAAVEPEVVVCPLWGPGAG